jgi:hypothetical protein
VTITFEPPHGAAARLLFQEDESAPVVHERVPPFQPSRSALERYRGRYYSEELDTSYEVELQGEQLVLKRRKYAPQILRPVAADVFVSPLGTVRFVPDAAGHPSTFLLTTARVQGLRFVRKG